MKLKASTGRKLRYGGTSVALTALIIAAVIIVNVIFSLCVERFTWYVDLTPELKFTISDDCYDLIGKVADDGVDSPIEMVKKFRAENKKYNSDNGLKKGDKDWRDEEVKINILFLMEKDLLQNDETTNYVVVNAEELRSKFPDYITIEYVDAVRHPSRYTKYLSSNTDTIDQESVIIECGTEYRIRTLRSFYIFEDAETPVAYNGEKAFAASILAVTRAESPVACYTVNHGEAFPVAEDGTVPFMTALTDAGYLIRPIDLSKEDIPEECRIMVVFDPKNDFEAGNDGVSEVNELTKLDDFLVDRNSLMVFMEPDSYTGRLDNLEDFLEEWGLALRRDGDDAFTVRDDSSSIMGDSTAVVGEYAQNTLAQGWLADMTNRSNPAKVVFPSAAALTYADGYDRKLVTDPDDENLKYYIGYSATHNRTVYDLFYSSEKATAWAGDREIAAATPTDRFSLCSVSVHSYLEQEYAGAIQDSAYVMLCGTTQFAAEKYLKSNVYGNSDFMLSALQMAGREPVAVGLRYKEFANYTIETITTNAATTYTVILTLAPIVIALITGVVIIVRRKNR